MQPPVQPPTQGTPSSGRGKKILLIVGGIVAVLAVMAVIGSQIEEDPSMADAGRTSAVAPASSEVAVQPTTAPQPSSTTAPTTTVTSVIAPVAPAPAPAAAVPAGCTPAAENYTTPIGGSLTDPTHTLANTYTVEGADDLVYIGANIMQGEKRVSSADVWVAKGPAIYSLSGGARENSALVDGRKVLKVSAGDEYGEAVQKCVIAGMRAGN